MVMLHMAVIWPEILLWSSRKSDLEEFSVLWSFLCMKGVFKSIMSSMVLFHQFEGKIITALNEFLCRKLPKDSGPTWFEFQYKMRNSCFAPITAIFSPQPFNSASACCVASNVLISRAWKQALLDILNPNFYEYSSEVTYLHTSLFPALCSSQPLWIEQVGKLVFLHIKSINIAFIQLHCLRKYIFISMKPYNE